MKLLPFWPVIKYFRFGPLFFIVRLLLLVIMMIIEINYSIKNPGYFPLSILIDGFHGLIKFGGICIFLLIGLIGIFVSIRDSIYKIMPNRGNFYFLYSIYGIVVCILISLILYLLLFTTYNVITSFQCESKEKISYNGRLKISASMSAVDGPGSYTEINGVQYRTKNYEYFENWEKNNGKKKNDNNPDFWLNGLPKNNGLDGIPIKGSGVISYEMSGCWGGECMNNNYKEKCIGYFTIEHLSKR